MRPGVAAMQLLFYRRLICRLDFLPGEVLCRGASRCRFLFWDRAWYFVLTKKTRNDMQEPVISISLYRSPSVAVKSMGG